MKPLTTPQYRELVELSRPGYPDMDPSSEPVCQELRREGFAVITRTEEDGDDEIEFWDITERGRLALRIHLLFLASVAVSHVRL
ncbi:MAG TPA: hypothetical protein VE967_19620 [Gemmatimonadaceae bacterium]|nr:hypothetical protein [Gemmatimonadaceae bacterium]